MMNIFVWLFESSLLIVMILGIRKFFTGKISYHAIYALWGIVLLRLVFPVNLFATHLSLENCFVREQAASTEQGITDNKKESSEEVNGKTAEVNDGNALPAIMPEEDDMAQDALKKGQEESLYKKAGEKENLNVSANGQRQEAGKESVLSNIFTRENMVEKVLVIIWFSVAVAMFCFLAFSNLRFMWKVRKSRTLFDSRGRVKIYTAAVPGACLYGAFRPAIYLPDFLVKSCIDREYEEQIIAHELTHYRHGDHIWAMVRAAVLVVYWFNPFVWLAAWLSRKDAELSCDEATIQQLGEEKRFDYGEMLIRLAGGAGQERLVYSAVFMSRRGKDMEKRIRAISEKKRYSRWIAVPLVILLLVAVGITCSRAVGSSGQPENTIDLVNNADTAKTTEEIAAKAKEEAAREQNLKESQETYQSFLKEHEKEAEYRYYSLAELEKGQYVLMTSDRAIEIGEDDDGKILWGTSHCQVYHIVSGEVTSCGKIGCSSSGEWIHYLTDNVSGNGQLATDTHHSISRYTLGEGQELIEDRREEYKKAQEKEYWEWYDEWDAAPGILFYTNPAVKKVRKNEPEALELAGDVQELYRTYGHTILSYLTAEFQADITGDDAEDTIRMELDKVKQPAADTENSVTVISGSSGKEIYGLNVNLVHDGWRGVYLYRSGGHASLMTWQPTMYQGIANYQWEIFDVSENGRETILAQDSLSFDLNNVKEDDPEKLEEFVEKFNSYLKDASRIIEISDGRVLQGGEVDYDRGGHYKGEFDAEDNWVLTYTAEPELKEMRKALQK